MQVELRAYQAQKTEEIGALERRLRLLLEFGRDGPVGRGDEDVAAPGPTPLNQACPEEEGEDDSQPPAIHISVKRTRRGARKGVPIQIPTRVAIPSGVNVKKRAKGRRDASSGEEEEEGAELDSVIQSLMQEAAQSIAMCSPNAPEAGVAGEGDNNKARFLFAHPSAGLFWFGGTGSTAGHG